MYSKEHNQFKEQFSVIVRQNALIAKQTSCLRQLHVWDDMGSHKKAILKCMDHLDVLKKDLCLMLKGLPYEDWLILSKKINLLNSRLKSAITLKEKCETALSALNFNFLKN